MPKHIFPQGALELMILRVIAQGSFHGWGIAQKIHLLSSEALKVDEGSLYPTLSRMQQRGWIKSKIGVSENNRQAKFYKLTTLGKMKLKKEQKEWEAMVEAVGRVLRSE